MSAARKLTEFVPESSASGYNLIFSIHFTRGTSIAKVNFNYKDSEVTIPTRVGKTRTVPGARRYYSLKLKTLFSEGRH